MTQPTVGSLFSGIGGFDLGLERVGFRIAWQCEIDRSCRKVLDRRWPDVTKYGDIRKLRGDELEPTDLICGGFPCQDLSVAGKRKGLAGERSGLFYEFLRIIAATTPPWILIENVPGLISSWCPVEPPPYEVPTRSFDTEEDAQRWADSLEGSWDVEEGSDFATVVSSLADVGYCVAWRVFDAQYAGVAQRRKRVFFVGSFGNPGAFEVLFESEGLPGNSPPSRQTGSGSIGDPAGCVRVHGVPDICGPLTSGSGKCGWKVSAENAADGQLVVAPTLRTNYRNNSNPITEASMLVCAETVNPLRASAGPATHAADASKLIVIQDGGRGTDKDQNGLGITEDGPCYTLDAMSQHAIVVAPTLSTKNEVASSSTQRWKWMEQCAGLIGLVRRLMPVEYEVLQGFPRDWTKLDDKTPDAPRYSACGNAVCPNEPEWIGKRLYPLIVREKEVIA